MSSRNLEIGSHLLIVHLYRGTIEYVIKNISFCHQQPSWILEIKKLHSSNDKTYFLTQDTNGHLKFKNKKRPDHYMFPKYMPPINSYISFNSEESKSSDSVKRSIGKYQLYMMGNNTSGQLGQPENLENLNYPNPIDLDFEIKKVCCLDIGTFAIDQTGFLFRTGEIPCIRKWKKTYGFELVEDFGFHPIRKIGINREFIIVQYKEEGLKGFSLDNFEELFHFKLEEAEIVDFVLGTDFLLILFSNGQIYGLGNNDQGQLGFYSKTSGVRIPQVNENLSNIKKIFCNGLKDTIVLDSNGNFWAFGVNDSDKFGEGYFGNYPKKLNFPFRGKKAAIGADYTLLLFENGEVYSCGENDAGALGHGKIKALSHFQKIPLKFKVKDIVVHDDSSCIMDSEGYVYTFGFFNFDPNSQGHPSRISSSQFSKISMGSNHLAFLKRGG